MIIRHGSFYLVKDSKLKFQSFKLNLQKITERKLIIKTGLETRHLSIKFQRLESSLQIQNIINYLRAFWHCVISKLTQTDLCFGMRNFCYSDKTSPTENFKRAHDSIKPPVWFPASSLNLPETCAARSLCHSPRCARPHSPPPNWIRTNLATPRWTKPGG